MAAKRIKYWGINLPKEIKGYTQKTKKPWWTELKTTQTDGEIFHVPELKESILWKWLYHQMQSTDSIKSLSNYQWHFSQNWTKNLTIHMETQKTLNSQSSLEKEEWNWRNQPSWLQTILQSYSHQESMVLAQKQKYRPMEQDRKSRDKPTHLWVPYFWQRREEYTMGQRQPLQ